MTTPDYGVAVSLRRAVGREAGGRSNGWTRASHQVGRRSGLARPIVTLSTIAYYVLVTLA